MALSSTDIVKVIVVTDDLEKTVSAYKTLLGTGKAPKGESTIHEERKIGRTPFMKYKGDYVTNAPMKVESVYSDNFWFEIIRPLGDKDPWADWLKVHGTSICSICLLSDGCLEDDEKTMDKAGFDLIFKHDKGYEAYEYFDTSKALGVLIEVKDMEG